MPPSKVDYDAVAPVYDERYKNHAFPGTTEALMNFVPARARVLEVGCGTGHWLALLEAAGCVTSGLDASTDMLDKARERGLRAQLVHGSAIELPFEEASFDRVYCINALHHFPAPARFFLEAARVLRPGGAILSIGMDPNVVDEPWFVYDYFERTRTLDKQRYATGSAVRGWLQEAGFIDCATRVTERIVFDRAARESLESGVLTKQVTSQLLLLSDDEYARGVAHIERDIAAAEARNEILQLHADLRLYGTTGHLPG